jgi:hypothetical protein
MIERTASRLRPRNYVGPFRVGRMMNVMRRALPAVLLVPLLVACSSAGESPAPTPGATAISATSGTASAGPGATIEPGTTPGPIPVPSAIASVASLDRVDLRYRLVDGLGRPLFCDPDFYPVARADEAALAAQHLAAIKSDAPTYAAIVAHLGIDPSTTPTADQVLAIYRDWKLLRALLLTKADGRFGFDYVAAAGSSGGTGFHVTGTIDAAGKISVARRDPSGPPPCPICLARGTRIATPDGERPVEDLQPGMTVWTTDGTGLRVAGRVAEVGSATVPPTHEVVHLVLSDGRTVDVSPGHGLPDGRYLGDLKPGDQVDGATVVSANLEAYRGGTTFDLLPSGSSGAYWANGVLLASTLIDRDTMLH